MLSVSEQMEALGRGVEAIKPRDEFVKKLERSVATGVPLRVKYGIDPTGIDVHLGHTVPLRKLRQFQDLGHTAVIIIGNYTRARAATLGPRRDPGQAHRGAGPGQRQGITSSRVGRIIDLSRAEVHHNGDWFSTWSFLRVLDLTRQMTLGQISAREDFAKRIAAKKPVYLHECIYPLMQGWDSVEIKADVELGGTEQLFSLLVARDLQASEGQPGQVAMTMPILVGTDGTRRMGKSLGNYIGVAEDPVPQFAKVMSIPDEPMRQYFTLLTDLPLSEVDRLLGPGVNPRDAKEVLGKAIVSQYAGPEAADHAAAEFRRRAKGEDPSNVEEIKLDVREGDGFSSQVAAFLVNQMEFDTSTSNARRMIEQGGVSVGPDRYVVRDPKAMISGRFDKSRPFVEITQGSETKVIPWEDLVVRYGKRKIRRIRFEL